MVQKGLRKISQRFWKEFLKWYDGGTENEITLKRIFEVEAFSPLTMLTSPLFEETFGAFLFPFLFSFSFSLSLFSASSLEDLGVSMISEEKITSSKTSFHVASTYWRWTHILEWSYALQHG
jgi:hypothetical protein